MEEDFQLDEKIAGLVKNSKSLKFPYGILKKFTIVKYLHGEQDTDQHYTTTVERLQESTHF